MTVSIPQAGRRPFSLPKLTSAGGTPLGFQSLKREDGHLAYEVAPFIIHFVPFQSLKREDGHLAQQGGICSDTMDAECFNPSSGKTAI